MKINGSKTYIAGGAFLMYAIGGFVSGQLDVNSAIQASLTALSVMGLRHGIGKINVEKVAE